MENFDPDNFAPIRREHCLSLRWFDDDPMPHVCALKYGHTGDHATSTWGGTAGNVGSVSWADDELGEVA